MIVAILLALTGIYAQAAEIRNDHRELAAKIADPELRSMTERVLQEKNHYYQQEALKNQEEKGENFTYARVEVTGVMSNDDTGEYDRSLFQEQIKPSFSAVENMSFFERALYYAKRKADPMSTAELIGDSVEYSNAARGVTTANARKKLEPYRNAEINELVAHSWGCELVYAAILNGDIRPPKKLIVVGVPDNDRKKWDLLAAYTGTEVHWARSDNDVVRHAQDDAETVGLKAGAAVDFGAKWESACAARSCRAHKRRSKPVVVEHIGTLPGIGGHARTEYYDALKRSKVITDTYEELHTSMLSNLEVEERRVKKAALEEALVEARGLVAEAHEVAAMARRDRDERLRNNLVAIAERACANRGDVTQAELDELPQPIGQDFASTAPPGLKGCVLDVYGSLTTARTAKSANAVQSLYVHEVLPAPGQGLQPDPYIPAKPKIPFESVLPGLKNYAVRACKSTGEVPVNSSLTDPRERFAFMRDLDDRTANRLAAGLGDCEGRLFRDLIWAIRHGNGRMISSDWVKNTIAGYSPPPPDTSSGNTPPPPRQKTDDPPVNRSCPVDENGVRACPAGW